MCFETLNPNVHSNANFGLSKRIPNLGLQTSNVLEWFRFEKVPDWATVFRCPLFTETFDLKVCRSNEKTIHSISRTLTKKVQKKLQNDQQNRRFRSSESELKSSTLSPGNVAISDSDWRTKMIKTKYQLREPCKVRRSA